MKTKHILWKTGLVAVLAASVAPRVAQGAEARSTQEALHIVAGMPEPESDPFRWRVALLTRANRKTDVDLAKLTVDVDGGSVAERVLRVNGDSPGAPRIAFRRIPRGRVFPTPPDDQVFGPAATSFKRNTAILCAEDCYMQTGPTEWKPIPQPQSPGRVMAVGPCPYFSYDGTGVADLRIDGARAMLRIYPDVERLRDDLRGTLEKPLTRLRRGKRPFKLLLPGWAGARVEHRTEDGWEGVDGKAGEFTAEPGTYRFTKP